MGFLTLRGHKQYYIDPLSADTNNDGQPDTQECWTAFPRQRPRPGPGRATWTPMATTSRTSLTGTTTTMACPTGWTLGPLTRWAPSAAATPSSWRSLKVETSVLTFVDLQLRPTNPAHLTYAFNVLDWPSGDAEGQVQRVLDTTFADGMKRRGG